MDFLTGAPGAYSWMTDGEGWLPDDGTSWGRANILCDSNDFGVRTRVNHSVGRLPTWCVMPTEAGGHGEPGMTHDRDSRTCVSVVGACPEASFEASRERCRYGVNTIGN